jgi:archaellum biogenesis protein FlaJ (TadC family)
MAKVNTKMNSKNRYEKLETLYKGLMLIVVGVAMIFLLPNMFTDIYVSLFLFLGGVAFIGFGLAECGLTLHWQEKLLKWHRQRMKHADEGVVWVWAVCLAGIVMYAIAYYALVMPTLQMIGIVESMTTFDASAGVTLGFVKVVLNWHPILFIVGLLLWAYVNSVRREDVTYPIY